MRDVEGGWLNLCESFGELTRNTRVRGFRLLAGGVSMAGKDGSVLYTTSSSYVRILNFLLRIVLARIAPETPIRN